MNPKLLSEAFEPKTPEILYSWMISNLKYYGSPKKYLYTPDEVLNKKMCHCWEATSFAYKYLTMMGFDCSIIYLETSNLSATHSTVCYSGKATGEFYWFEYTWESQRGIHRYKNIHDLTEDLARKFKREFKEVSMMSIGNTLIADKTLQSDYYKTMTERWNKLFTKSNVSPVVVDVYQEHNSTFTSDGITHDLNVFWKATHNDPTLQINVSDLEWVLKYTKDHSKNDEERINRADLSAPLLVTKYGDKELVVDGLHRLQKAVRLNVKRLPYKRISEKLLKSAVILTNNLPAYEAWK